MSEFANDTDPLTLPGHPLPVRTLIPQIPRTLLSNILTSCAEAYQPQEIKILNLNNEYIELAYMQPPPQREMYFNPVPRRAKIELGGDLPPLPPLPKGKDRAAAELDESYIAACLEWETTVAARLQELDRASINMMEGRTDITVESFIPPQDKSSLVSLAIFLLLSLIIIIHLAFNGDAPAPLDGISRFLATNIFSEEWKLNAAVIAHTILILKRASDVFKMAEKCRRFRVDLYDRKIWIMWLLAGALEGWRAVQRLELEADRVGRALAIDKKKKT